MRAIDILQDAFGRNHEGVPYVLRGLDGAWLQWQIRPGVNSIGWLIWHLARVEDAQVADAAGTTQVWLDTHHGVSFADRADLDLPADSTGYAHTAEQVAVVKFSGPELLQEYYAAVSEASRTYLGDLTDQDLDRIVDQRWDPPVTLGVRLVSIADDCAQHLGQVAYLKGLLERGADQ